MAGLSAVESLRDGGYDGPITVVDSSPGLPTDRPPLSKQVLAGTMSPDAASLPAASRLPDLDVDVRLGTTASQLDPAGRRITFSDGRDVTYGGLVIATGATPRRLDTALGGVHTLRTLEDALALRAELLAARSCVVVGAGFIGCEVAATARGMGLDVTVVEFADRPMQRVLPGEVGGFVADLLVDHGIAVRFGVGVERFEGTTRVERVILGDGSVLDADVVVVGTGVTPATGWLDGSGLDIDNGLICDETLTVAPGVVAAGDLARWHNRLYGETMRVEQWENAVDQGGHAARSLLAGDAAVPYTPVPWFWSDLFDRKLQLAGRVSPGDEVSIVEGSIDERRFVALFRRGERCVAVLGVNRPRPVVRLRLRMAAPLSWDDALSMVEPR